MAHMAQRDHASENEWKPDWQVTVTRDDVRGHCQRHKTVGENPIHNDPEAAKSLIPEATDIIVPGALIHCFLDEAVCSKYPSLIAGRGKFDFKDVLQPGDDLGFFFVEERPIKRPDGIECLVVKVEAKRNRNGEITTIIKYDLILSAHAQSV